jgi:hypothetical protein
MRANLITERTLEAVSGKPLLGLALSPRPAQSAAPTARPLVEKQCLTPLLGPSQWL